MIQTLNKSIVNSRGLILSIPVLYLGFVWATTPNLGIWTTINWLAMPLCGTIALYL